MVQEQQELEQAHSHFTQVKIVLKRIQFGF